ncbi:alginate lyase family protein [Paenibacillus sp. Soil787]|uniref:alginate lyase family protein n=1 Tax=Paenibacillus sp. Soil787 TaxID=1736411 RepID=UPI000AF8ECB6|nr:alginate lyase family protein [Paenibacillus sp. Soil787]
MSAAYAYALTEDIKYAEKVATFLRYFIDDEIGYPKKKKGCSQSYVQEGHFFQHLAIPYDIIHQAGVLTPEEHKGIEKTFRIYMDILDKHIHQGHISNWLLSEITGAFYCALAIQDIERALRFAFGMGGSIHHLKYGLFNDGWWHECSVGYNTWVSSMYIHTAHALLPFGINILHTHFPIPFNDEVNSTYNGEDAKVRFGMYNKKWGGNRKNYVCIKDMFDATIPFLDYRGVMFGISDSDERKLEGVHFGSTFDLAYRYYKDPEYIPVIHQNVNVDPIFGHAELPEYRSSYVKNNAYADNVGIAMLRSQTENREQKDQIQAVIRYGSHGYAHGHFDRTEVLSIMRYGRSFFNPEHVWWGYPHFMYKFYVQNSMTKNMVVVDEKMQVPSDSKRLLFYSGKAIQAVAIETNSKWSYPPYGGMIYNETETLEERSKMNASSLPEVQAAPPYGELSDFTEPITQKRVMGVTDDYLVLFDYLKGETEHQYDSLFQIKGFKGIKTDTLGEWKHTSQFTENPLSDAQFITDCQWYEAAGTSVASFETIFGEGEDMRGTRTAHNTPGLLKMDVHTAWPKQSIQIVGRTAEDHGYTIPLEYQVEVDGKVKAEGEFGAWLLSERKCEIDLQGARALTLRVKNKPTYNEQKYPQKTKQGLFWGEAYVITADGRLKNFCDLDVVYENIDRGFGIGKDYEGGRVTIVGNEYPAAIPTSPVDHDKFGTLTLDLSGMNAVRFVGLIGADAFPGDEAQRRKTYAVRPKTKDKIGRYITIVEPFETESMIVSVQAADANTVEVILKDGRTQIISVNQIEHDEITVNIMEYKNGILIHNELACGR